MSPGFWESLDSNVWSKSLIIDDEIPNPILKWCQMEDSQKFGATTSCLIQTSKEQGALAVARK